MGRGFGRALGEAPTLRGEPELVVEMRSALGTEGAESSTTLPSRLGPGGRSEMGDPMGEEDGAEPGAEPLPPR